MPAPSPRPPTWSKAHLRRRRGRCGPLRERRAAQAQARGVPTTPSDRHRHHPAPNLADAQGRHAPIERLFAGTPPGFQAWARARIDEIEGQRAAIVGEAEEAYRQIATTAPSDRKSF